MTKNLPADGERKDMKQETENKQCQICKGYLFDDDDVVICPICGAPHHRDCYSSVGHCGAEDAHGTDRQYDKVKAEEDAAEAEAAKNEENSRECRFCHRTSRSSEGDFCPYCGQPYSVNGKTHRTHAGPGVFVGNVPMFDIYGGLPKDSKIEDVKVEHIAKFVGSNSQRYLPKFATLSSHKKGSWNWAAFLSPSAWCLSRKMVAPGIMYFILMLASALCFVPFNATLSNIMTDEMQSMTYMQLAREITSEYMSDFSVLSLIMSLVGLVLNIIPRIICGKMGDWMYRGFTLQNVRKITANPDVEDLDTELMKKGSVSLLVLAIALLAENYVPTIITSFIW